MSDKRYEPSIGIVKQFDTLSGSGIIEKDNGESFIFESKDFVDDLTVVSPIPVQVDQMVQFTGVYSESDVLRAERITPLGSPPSMTKY